ncbi:MAG: HIRAN domain-containing protein [Methanobrevibacter wolinii]|nr:HIRAN domain-containing protein [Methanobrevibacter wolinii]
MSNIEKYTGSDIGEFIGYIHKGGKVKSFDEDIYLINIHVAGLYYIEYIDEILSDMKIGDILKLSREKCNRYDSYAILIKYNNKKVGYVPKNKNLILANLMDGGKELYGVITSLSEPFENYKSIKCDVFLKD